MVSVCLFSSTSSANLFRFNDVDVKIEYFSMKDASPFSPGKMGIRSKSSVSFNDVTTFNDVEKIDSKNSQWNLDGDFGLGMGSKSACGCQHVAVLDTGVINHVELKGRLIEGFDFIKKGTLVLMEMGEIVIFPHIKRTLHAVRQ